MPLRPFARLNSEAHRQPMVLDLPGWNPKPGWSPTQVGGTMGKSPDDGGRRKRREVCRALCIHVGLRSADKPDQRPQAPG